MAKGRVFLIGARCSGKSTVGRYLARLLACDMVDTDTLIIQDAGCSVAEIVEKEGWPGFRQREFDALRHAVTLGRVISTGGGIVLDPANVAFMRKQGKVVYLAACVETLQKRLSSGRAAKDRPSLTGADPAQEVADILARRDPLYRQAAHILVNAHLAPKKVARVIAGFL